MRHFYRRLALTACCAVLPMAGAAAAPKKPSKRPRTTKTQPKQQRRAAKFDFALRSPITLSAVKPFINKATLLFMKLPGGVTVDPTAGPSGTIKLHRRCNIANPFQALAGVPIRNHVEVRFRAESARPYRVECRVTAGTNSEGETVAPKMKVNGSASGATWNAETGRLAVDIAAKLGERDVPVQICGDIGGITVQKCTVTPLDRVDP